MLWGEGTIGNSGGREEEERYLWRVIMVIVYYILNIVDRVSGSLTSGYKWIRVSGFGVGWVVFIGLVLLGLWFVLILGPDYNGLDLVWF